MITHHAVLRTMLFWGAGEQAVLDYLARYVFRVGITNARLVGLDEKAVTIRYKQRQSARWRTCRIAGGHKTRWRREPPRSLSL